MQQIPIKRKNFRKTLKNSLEIRIYANFSDKLKTGAACGSFCLAG
jgi:hypothetical protein